MAKTTESPTEINRRRRRQRLKKASEIQSPRYVTAAVLAVRYDVSERTIWRWSKNGTLPKPAQLTEQCSRFDLVEIERREAERAAKQREAKAG